MGRRLVGGCVIKKGGRTHSAFIDALLRRETQR